MGEEYDPFEEPEEEAPAAGDAGAAGAAGGEPEAPAPEKIVMKLDAGKKKAKVAAVFDEMDDLLGSGGEENDEELADFEVDEQPPLPPPEEPAADSSAADGDGDDAPPAARERHDERPAENLPDSRSEDSTRLGREDDRARDRRDRNGRRGRSPADRGRERRAPDRVDERSTGFSDRRDDGPYSSREGGRGGRDEGYRRDGWRRDDGPGRPGRRDDENLQRERMRGSPAGNDRRRSRSRSPRGRGREPDRPRADWHRENRDGGRGSGIDYPPGRDNRHSRRDATPENDQAPAVATGQEQTRRQRRSSRYDADGRLIEESTGGGVDGLHEESRGVKRVRADHVSYDDTDSAPSSKELKGNVLSRLGSRASGSERKPSVLERLGSKAPAAPESRADAAPSRDATDDTIETQSEQSEQLAGLQPQEVPETSTLKALERGEKFGTLSANQKEELAALRSENPPGTAPAATTAMEDAEKDGKATVGTDAGQEPADPGKDIETQPEKSEAELAKDAEWEAKRERDRKKRAEWEAAEAARKEKRLAAEEVARAKKKAKEEANAERLRAERAKRDAAMNFEAKAARRVAAEQEQAQAQAQAAAATQAVVQQQQQQTLGSPPPGVQVQAEAVLSGQASGPAPVAVQGPPPGIYTRSDGAAGAAGAGDGAATTMGSAAGLDDAPPGGTGAGAAAAAPGIGAPQLAAPPGIGRSSRDPGGLRQERNNRDPRRSREEDHARSGSRDPQSLFDDRGSVRGRDDDPRGASSSSRDPRDRDIGGPVWGRDAGRNRDPRRSNDSYIGFSGGHDPRRDPRRDYRDRDRDVDVGRGNQRRDLSPDRTRAPVREPRDSRDPRYRDEGRPRGDLHDSHRDNWSDGSRDAYRDREGNYRPEYDGGGSTRQRANDDRNSQSDRGRSDGDIDRGWQQPQQQLDRERERDRGRLQQEAVASSDQTAVRLSNMPAGGEGAEDPGIQMQMDFEAEMEMGAEAASMAKAEARKSADDEAATKKRRHEKAREIAEKEKKRKAEKRKREKDLRARSKAKKEVEAKQLKPTVIEEPTHLASLLQEEPLELAAPEELFSKNNVDDAAAAAGETVGQGATALMLDAILKDSSAKEEQHAAAATTATAGSTKEKKKETALKKAFRGRIEEFLKPHYKKKEIDKEQFKTLMKKCLDKSYEGSGSKAEATVGKDAKSIDKYFDARRQAKLEKLVSASVQKEVKSKTRDKRKS